LRARYRFSDIDGLDGFQALMAPARARRPRRLAPGQLGRQPEYKYDTSDYADESFR
jgi:hypothetical protein